MRFHFIRASVDLDPSGQPVGWSYEVHDYDDGVVAFGCGNSGPFETIDEFLRDAIDAAHFRTGLHNTLPGL